MTAPGAGARVAVIGGGLAGIAAAVALESAGIGVTLIESRKTLGGRAGSFEDPQSGQELDNCQHVLLGCCTNLIDLYGRIGALELIRFERAIYLTDAAGRRFALGASRGVAAPFHLSASLLQRGWLTWSERVALSHAMIAIMRIGREGRAELAEVSFGDWLDQHKQPASLGAKVYDPILISALNENTRDVAASYATQVLFESLLANRRGCAIGLPTCTLARLYGGLIEGKRDIRVSCRSDEVRVRDNAAVGVALQNGERIDADAVVLAVNHANAVRQLPAETADPRFVQMQNLQDVPILGAHLWFDRPILDVSHTGLLQGPLQWLFRKDARGCAVHGVISAARDWLDVPRDECARQFEAQIRATLPAARDAKLERFTIVIEKRATFSPSPGCDRHRPSQSPPAGGIVNLYLAGDYTQSGWPATMEGAVRSGYLAAEAIAAKFSPGRAARFVVDDLPVQWPARALAR